MLFNNRMTKQQIEIIKRFTDEVPVRLGALATELGLQVMSATLPHGKSGQIAPSASAPSGFAIRINRHESMERQRFTLAHEIAHFLLHREKIKNGITESVLYRADGITSQEEVEANKLAAEITMPSAKIKERLGNQANNINEEIVIQFARDFKMSTPAMEIRLGLR